MVDGSLRGDLAGGGVGPAAGGSIVALIGGLKINKPGAKSANNN